jgi:hypothetical protein
MNIVRRAYELWERTGKPDGRDQEFYHQAEQELPAQNSVNAASAASVRLRN